MICVTAVYPNRPGSRFDADYYRTRHAPFAAALMAPHGLLGVRLSEGIGTLDGGAPRFWMLSEMRFASRPAFDAAMARCGAALFGDAANFTDVEPTLQLSAEAVEVASQAATETESHA